MKIGNSLFQPINNQPVQKKQPNRAAEEAAKVEKTSPQKAATSPLPSGTLAEKASRVISQRQVKAQSSAELSRQEKSFFEQLFPKQRKEIKAYLNQKNPTNLDKGQIIDLKG
jgi:hypothetical protein